jgi:GDPmannose 4,6-dehydratase
LRALITGITGQDGSYLAEFLLRKGYEVHGLIRRSSNFNTQRIDHLLTSNNVYQNKVHLHFADLTDGSRIVSLLLKILPSEVYNLGAQSHVKVSFDEPEYTGLTTGLGVTRILEAIRITQIPAKFYQASSSEMFGSVVPPQTETTYMHPRSPYAISKLYGYWMTKNYREAYNLFAVNGILFNHESPRRGETFVTRKITKAAANIYLGQQKKLVLGNLEATRDWGFAPEYVEAMWLMLQQETPRDFVIATGIGTTVREFLDYSFGCLNLNWENYIMYDSKYERPTEVNSLIGDAELAKKFLSWKPRIMVKELASLMVNADIKLLQNKELKISDANLNYWN